MNQFVSSVSIAILVVVLGACGSPSQPPTATYSVTAAELGWDGDFKMWETERHPEWSLVRVSRSGQFASMPPLPPDPQAYDSFEMRAFADLASQRGFQWFEVQREQQVSPSTEPRHDHVVWEYRVAFSNRDAIAEQPSYPLNNYPHGAAMSAERPVVPQATSPK